MKHNFFEPEIQTEVLPDIDFLRLRENSDLIDKGTNVGLPYNGDAPDLGAFEHGTYTPPPVTIPVNTGIDFNETYPKTIDLYFDYAINSQIVPPVTILLWYLMEVQI